MKRYVTYRDIRKQALIFGLPIGSFAIQMISVILSLLVIIFSFSFLIILALPCWNLALYIFLLRSAQLRFPYFRGNRVSFISNRYTGITGYEASFK